jgi:hypothetical protein
MPGRTSFLQPFAILHKTAKKKRTRHPHGLVCRVQRLAAQRQAAVFGRQLCLACRK